MPSSWTMSAPVCRKIRVRFEVKWYRIGGKVDALEGPLPTTITVCAKQSRQPFDSRKGQEALEPTFPAKASGSRYHLECNISPFHSHNPSKYGINGLESDPLATTT